VLLFGGGHGALSFRLCVVDRDAVVFVDTPDAPLTRGDRRGQCEHNNCGRSFVISNQGPVSLVQLEHLKYF